MQTLIAAKLTPAINRIVYTPDPNWPSLPQKEFSYAAIAEKGDHVDGYLVTVTMDDGTEVAYGYVSRHSDGWYFRAVRADVALDALDTITSNKLKAQGVKPHALYSLLSGKARSRKVCLALCGLTA